MEAPDRDKDAERKRLLKLKEATRKAEKLRNEMRAAVRDDAFDDWVRRCTFPAETPHEWTQAAVLYASYLKWAAAYGWNRQDRRLSQRELATATRFGFLLRDVGVLKLRRAKGWYYPLRLKQGA